MILLSLTVFTACTANYPDTDSDRLGPLVLEVWVNTTKAQVGTPIQIRYVVTNIGDQARVIELMDRPVMDILIAFDSRITHEFVEIHWSGGRQITGDLHRLVWEPGEAKTLEMTWIVDALADNSPVDVAGLLRFGEREGETTSAGVRICVGRCGPE